MSVEKAVAALVAILTALLDRLLAFRAGSATTQAKAKERDLEAVERANKAAADNRRRPDADRLSDAEQRGLYRD